MNSQRGWNRLPSIAADCALVGLNWLLIGALVVALRILFPQVRLFEHAAPAPRSLLGIALLHSALIALIGRSEYLYTYNRDLGHHAQILARSVLYATGLLCIAYRLQGSSAGVSIAIAAAGALHFTALFGRRWEEQRRNGAHSSQHLRNVLVLGAAEAGRQIVSYIEQHPEQGRIVCGFLDNQRPLGNGVLGRLGDLAYLARKEFIDELIVTAPYDRSLIVRVLHEARHLHLDVKLVPDTFGYVPSAQEVERIGDHRAICLHQERLPAAGLFLKRAMDITGATVALVILSPVFVAVAAAVKLSSRGPVLYCAQRAGRKGKPFRCYKFRTMAGNADELKAGLRARNQRSGPFFKIMNDPRITCAGKFLRRYSLDELPQLWNVLRGEMSLVGPRPHPLDDVAAYQVEHLSRLDVTPGITGLWQVNARRDPSFQRGMELDRQYIRSWGLGLDMRILFKTVSTVVLGSGD
jgi:exopolysaccharide biosynthesis polyprenyl glycosylphosphotransferase